MQSRPEYSVSLNNESNFAQRFRQHFKRFSNECQLPSRYLNWVFKVSATASCSNTESKTRNDRIALSVNSFGKSFHIDSTAVFSSAMLVGFGVVASQYRTPHDLLDSDLAT